MKDRVGREDERTTGKDQVHKNIVACGDGCMPVPDRPGALFICGIWETTGEAEGVKGSIFRGSALVKRIFEWHTWKEKEEPAEPVITDKYAALYEENEDLVGWLTIEGMVIDQEESFYREHSTISFDTLYDTGVTAEFGDTFLTLSTCACHVRDGRLAVVAKRLY